MLEQLQKYIIDSGVTSYKVRIDDYGDTREGVILLRLPSGGGAGPAGNYSLRSEFFTVIASAESGTLAKIEAEKVAVLLNDLRNTVFPEWVYNGKTFKAVTVANVNREGAEPRYVGQDEDGVKFYGTYFFISYAY